MVDERWMNDGWMNGGLTVNELCMDGEPMMDKL
jgi:hypothetical protein